MSKYKELFVSEGLHTLLPKEAKLLEVVDLSSQFTVNYRVHFLPESSSEVIQAEALHVIFTEVATKITQGSLPCPLSHFGELAALFLASLYPFGDGERHWSAVKHQIVPHSAVTDDNFFVQVSEGYKLAMGKSPAQLKRQYLANVEDLPMYGRSCFPVFSRANETVNMAVSASGIEVFPNTSAKRTPLLTLSWSDIKSISRKVRRLSYPKFFSRHMCNAQCNS